MVRHSAFLLLVACATATGQVPVPAPGPLAAPVAVAAPVAAAVPEPAPFPAEEILSSGGELIVIGLPPATVELTDAQVVVWGMTEVPADSRLQAALAMVDAIARAELLKYIRAGVASLALDVQTGAGQELARVDAEVAKGLLPGLAPPRHAWHKVRRGDEMVLRLYARLTVDREVAARAIAAALARPDGDALARRALEIVK